MSPHRVLGTAGHIDHGKTSLVRALTGADEGSSEPAGKSDDARERADRLDRLREEQERGITIELGFAQLTLPSGLRASVIDVPGHERFIRTMVAGAVGIDAVMLVVAADEGVMPQTREHLDICGLLGVRAGVVALSKADLVDGDLRGLALEELREALAGTFLSSAPIVPVSARTGEGLDALRAALDAVLLRVPGRDETGVTRLPVDKVFSLRGFGTVATGTLWSGKLRTGDELLPLPGPPGQSLAPAKVRGLHVHGAPVDEAVAGQRVAVNLALPREALLRGETLVGAGTVEASVLVDVELHYLAVARAVLPRRSRLLLHAGTAQRLAAVTLLDPRPGPELEGRAELRPGTVGLAQVQLDAPLLLLPGDRFVLRGFAPQKNHGTTVGGGVILRVQSARHRRGSAALSSTLRAIGAALLQLSSPERKPREAAARTLVESELVRRGVLGGTRAELRRVLPLGEAVLREALRGLVESRAIFELGADEAAAGSPAGAAGPSEALYVSAPALRLVSEVMLTAVAGFHQSQPRALGLPREALRQKLGPLGGTRAGAGLGEGPPSLCPARVVAAALARHRSAGRLVIEREKDVVRAPAHNPQAGADEQALTGRALALFRAAGLGPPGLAELPGLLGTDAGAIKQVVETLLRERELVRIKDLLFYRPHVDELRGRLIATLTATGELNPTQWKELVGQSRKFTIPLAEHFDAEKVTLRVGDMRRLRTVPGATPAPQPRESASAGGRPSENPSGIPDPVKDSSSVGSAQARPPGRRA